MDLNKAMLIGNVTRDPEIRQTAGGQPVASFSIATNLSWTDQGGQKQERAEFHNIIAWRKLADIVGRFVKKGSKIYIEGRIQNRSWVGQDGQKRYTSEIVADNLIMLDRAGGTQSYGGGNTYQPATAGQARPTVTQNNAPSTEQPISYEDVAPMPGYQEEEIRVENIPF